MSGANSGVIMNGTLTAGSATGADLIINQFGTGALDIQSVIANNGANVVTLVKAGTGELKLSGTNSFTGGVLLQSGILTVNSAAALGREQWPIGDDQWRHPAPEWVREISTWLARAV